MGLTEQINKDIIVAMKSGDKARLSVLRMLKSDLKYKQIELKVELTDEDCIAVMTSAAKKSRDAIEEYKKADRDDLMAKEIAELEIIKKYLPQQISEDELKSLIKEVINQTNASTPADIGMVMKGIMPKVKGRADGRKINQFVSEILRG